MTAILRLQLDDKDPVRVNSAINQLAEYSDRNTRIKLTANTTFYVSTSGSDSNSGSQVSPFLTIQHAYDIITGTLDTRGFTTTIQCASGTYTAGLVIDTPWGGGGQIILDLGGGTISTGGTCIYIKTSLSGTFLLQNGTVTSGSNSIVHAGTGVFALGTGLTFGTSGGAHIISSGASANIQINNAYTITGGGAYHYAALQAGNTIKGSGIAITITGTPAFSSAFVYATRLGLVDAESFTFSGSATGLRYFVDVNGVIFTAGGGATYFPGNAPGVISSGGQYV